MSPEKIHIHHIMAPQKVVSFDLMLGDKYHAQCVNEAYKIGDNMNHSTNVKASMTTYHVYEQTSVYNQILADITGAIKNAPWVNVDQYVYTLHSAWVSIYKSGDYTVPHIHKPSAVSFCYYIKADENSAPLVFDGTNFSIKPHSGLCVLFDGNLWHSVPEQTGSEDRLILAGNYSEDPK